MSRAVVARRRRTQSERSDAMRKRLIDATLRCLVEDGYAKVTVSAIVRRAGVSRGAHLHHFPSKNALILEAADYLMRRAYRILGEVLLGIAEEGSRARGRARHWRSSHSAGRRP
jgi:AcrR family transcriptional regulator